MMEEEEYNERLQKATSYLQTVDPKLFMNTIQTIKDELRAIREYKMAMGTEQYWQKMRLIEALVNKIG